MTAVAIPNPASKAPAGGASATSAPAKASSSRNAIIDGYRGIAAIGVIIAHVFLIDQFVFGTNAIKAMYSFFDVLPMFFALSGLMTYRTYVQASVSGRVPKPWPTIKSRLWRIYPVYALVIIGVWAMHFANSTEDWPNLFLHLSFLQVWSPHYVFFLDGPAWFIADDMHLVVLTALVAPVLCRLALRFPRTRMGMVARVSIMASLPVALILIGCVDIWYEVVHRANNATWIRYTPIFTAPEFGFGMLLGAFVFNPGVIKVRRLASWLLTGLGLGGILAANYIGWRLHWVNIYYFGYPIIALCCAVALAGALFASPTGLMARFMSTKPLTVLAAVGLTIVLIQEPLMIALQKAGFVIVDDPTSCWISGILMVCAATFVAWLLLKYVEEPAVRFREKLRKVDGMSFGRDRRHHGPIPRQLPDVEIQLPDGSSLPVRDALRGRPLLLAFGDLGLGALAEQRFRIDAGESDALHISASFDRSALESEALGASIAFDPDERLIQAMNIPVALVEVSPDGTITSFQRSRREALAAWS